MGLNDGCVKSAYLLRYSFLISYQYLHHDYSIKDIQMTGLWIILYLGGVCREALLYLLVGTLAGQLLLFESF